MNNWFDFSNFMNETENLIKSNDMSKTNQSIYFRSPGDYQLKTFIDASIAFGGPKRKQEAENFLKRFTVNTNSQNLNWVSILFSLDKKNKISGDKAKVYLESFKDVCLKWAEDNGLDAFVNFIRNLLIFETSSTDSAVVMAIRLKADIEDLVKIALSSISQIVERMSTTTESSYIYLKAHSNEDIYDSINTKKTLSDFFKTCEFKIKSFGFRKRLRSLFSNISSEKVNVAGFMQFLFVPYSLDINMTGDMDVTDPNYKEFMNFDLSIIGIFLDFLKQNISKDLLKVSDDIDIAFNAFDLFMHIKFYSEKMFSS